MARRGEHVAGAPPEALKNCVEPAMSVNSPVTVPVNIR
jgi:hypothetical protein